MKKYTPVYPGLFHGQYMKKAHRRSSSRRIEPLRRAFFDGLEAQVLGDGGVLDHPAEAGGVAPRRHPAVRVAARHRDEGVPVGAGREADVEDLGPVGRLEDVRPVPVVARLRVGVLPLGVRGEDDNHPRRQPVAEENRLLGGVDDIVDGHPDGGDVGDGRVHMYSLISKQGLFRPSCRAKVSIIIATIYKKVNTCENVTDEKVPGDHTISRYVFGCF